MCLGMASCAFMRGIVHMAPKQGDNRIFPAYDYTASETPNVFPASEISIPLLDADFMDRTKTDAIVVLINDTLVAESYCRDVCAFDKSEDLFSVTKTVVAALVGIAIDEGLIGSVDDNINLYIDGLHKSLAETTILELLLMRAGITDNAILTTQLYYGADLKGTLKKIRIADQSQVGRFNYSNASTQLLGTIVENATDKSIMEYFDEKIWSQLDMESAGMWTKDSKAYGDARMFVGLSMTARDIAKFGNLYLHEGRYRDRQIIPKEWVEITLQKGDYPPTEDDGYYYTRQIRAVDDNVVFAKGYLGQYLYINKNAGAVIVRIGDNDSDGRWIPYCHYMVSVALDNRQVVQAR